MVFTWIFLGFWAMVLSQSYGNFYGKSHWSAEKRQIYFVLFSERSRHLVGTDVKEILEIPCQCWIFRDSFPFLITRRSRGSNPVSATKKDSIVDTISAMEFCFICSKCLIFALLPLISAVLRAFFHIKTINPPSSAPQRQKWRILYRSRNEFTKILFFLLPCGII